jgi:RNA polymerase sigma-70 factor, ECF subfamily
MTDTATGTGSSSELAFGDSLAAVREGESVRIGDVLGFCRPYLMAIAQAELPSELHGKIGASDLVQETLTRGIEHFDDFRGLTPEELAGWLRRILLNHLANVRKAYSTGKRATRREQPADSGLADRLQTDPGAELVRLEEEARLERALSNLPLEYQRVIRLRHQENRSFTEIGAALGKSEDAAGKLWARALRRLRSELRRDDAVDG